jgi:hypothetical protein
MSKPLNLILIKKQSLDLFTNLLKYKSNIEITTKLYIL